MTAFQYFHAMNWFVEENRSLIDEYFESVRKSITFEKFPNFHQETFFMNKIRQL